MAGIEVAKGEGMEVVDQGGGVSSTPCYGDWIPVADTPKVSKVIIAYKFGVGEALFIDGKFWICGTEVPGVTHWMPLPEAPERK